MSAAKELLYTYTDITRKLEELPTLPTVVYELTRIINDPMSSTREIEAVLENDVALTARILKVANTAYYSIPGGCTNLNRAIAFLGFDTLSQLVTSTSIIDAFKVMNDGEFNIQQFWKHSIGVGVAAETIAKELKHPMPSDLFAAGLVHDMGKVAIAAFDANIPDQIAKYAKEHNLTFLEAEIKLLLPLHTVIGHKLAEKWKLPPFMHAAIHYHHELKTESRGNLSSELNQIVDIIYLANLITHALRFGHSGHQKTKSVPTELMGRLGMTAKDDFMTLAKIIKTSLEKSEELVKRLISN
jgi:HD-like signal output (HDOD) protein